MHVGPARQDVDAGRLGVYGPSMGGYLAPRSAAQDGRIKACAACGGMFDRSRVLNRLDDPFEFARVAHIWKVYDKEQLADLQRRSTLEGLAPKIRCPLLIVHGEADTYFPAHHVDALAAAAPDAEVWREPAMGHAEVATTAELIERIGAWVRAAYEQASRFCDDDPRE